MPSIDYVTLEVSDPTAADAFYAAAFGLGARIRVRATDAPTSGFRGYTMSLVVSQPSGVDSLVASAVEHGAETIEAPSKSFWGYGAVVRDPYGTIWKIASSSKKNTGPATRHVDSIVLGLGVSNVKATKQYYAERGLPVAKSFGSKYVEFATSTITLALYSRRFAAKTAGVDPDGSGSHRLAINSDAAGTIGTDPDGFAWE